MSEEELIKLENAIFVYPQLKEEWKKDIKNQYQSVLKTSVAAMECLYQDNNFEEVYKVITNDGYRSTGIAMCVGIVIYFTRKHAADFGEWVINNKNPEFATKDSLKYLEDLKTRNMRFDAELAEEKIN